MSVTIYDIAREAGVSIATVSRVFNNNTSVSLKTREKVLHIARQHDYHPHAMAQGLAKRKSGLITAIVPVISNYFFMEVLAGIQDKIADFDYELNIYNVRTNSTLEDQVEHLIKRGSADGFLIISVHLSDKKWSELKRVHVPIILIDEFNPEFDSVSVDSVEGSYLATRHLIEAGYQRIAMISALHESKPSQDRIQGYRRALEDAGRLFNEKLIIFGDNLSRDGFTERNGYEAMMKILAMDPMPDACFSSSDIQALGALKAMRDKDVSIPIIGFDDIRFSEFLGLTTMSQPMYEMGYLAIEKLIKHISKPDTEVSHTVFSPELVIRSTTIEGAASDIQIYQ